MKKLSKAASLAHEVNKTLGTDIKLGNDPQFQIERVPTGSLILDRITGGGFALGRHVELYGDESSCKSYISYRAMALSQQRGKLCALIDPEHSFDPMWFTHLGGSPKDLLAFHPTSADEAVAAMMVLAKHAAEKEVEIITIDSVASLVPREDLERDPREEDRMASQARMMSKALRKITTVNDSTLFLWINQERENIGIRFGNPKTTSGGRALRFYATTRIELRRGTKVLAERKVARAGKLVTGKVTVGRWIQVRCEKDKSTQPHREGSFVFDTDKGEISLESEIIELGLLDGIIERKGNSYFYTDLDDREWSGTYSRFTKWLATEDFGREIIAEIRDNTLHEEGSENG